MTKIVIGSCLLYTYNGFGVLIVQFVQNHLWNCHRTTVCRASRHGWKPPNVTRGQMALEQTTHLTRLKSIRLNRGKHLGAKCTQRVRLLLVYLVIICPSTFVIVSEWIKQNNTKPNDPSLLQSNRVISR